MNNNTNISPVNPSVNNVISSSDEMVPSNKRFKAGPGPDKNIDQEILQALKNFPSNLNLGIFPNVLLAKIVLMTEWLDFRNMVCVNRRYHIILNTQSLVRNCFHTMPIMPEDNGDGVGVPSEALETMQKLISFADVEKIRIQHLYSYEINLFNFASMTRLKSFQTCNYEFSLDDLSKYCPELEELILSCKECIGNGVDGVDNKDLVVIADHCKKLKKLKNYERYNFHCSLVAYFIQNLINLEELSLTNNPFSYEDWVKEQTFPVKPLNSPSEFGRKFKILSLENCFYLDFNLMLYLFQYSTLEKLSLTNCGFINIQPFSKIQQENPNSNPIYAKNLKYLDLIEDHDNSEGCEHDLLLLPFCKNLEEFTLSRWDMIRNADPSTENFEKLKKIELYSLENLDEADSLVTRFLLSLLEHSPHLTELYLSDTRVHKKILSCIQNYCMYARVISE